MTSLKFLRHAVSPITAALLIGLSGGAANAAPVALGGFTFDSNLFGDTLSQSDGGTFALTNWLNVINADPGAPGYLTGANFDTGIANIGGSRTYTIGYSTSIVNGAGADFAVVTARFSADPFSLTINGTTRAYVAASGVDSGVDKDYFYGGAGPYNGSLFVTSIDLADFGVANGVGISSITIGASTELDLIRVAGFDQSGSTAVPEPAPLALVGIGLLGLVASRSRKRG
jgi:hypothetical protein